MMESEKASTQNGIDSSIHDEENDEKYVSNEAQKKERYKNDEPKIFERFGFLSLSLSHPFHFALS